MSLLVPSWLLSRGVLRRQDAGLGNGGAGCLCDCVTLLGTLWSPLPRLAMPTAAQDRHRCWRGSQHVQVVSLSSCCLSAFTSPSPSRGGLCLLGALGTGGWAVSEWLLELCRHVFDVGAVESGGILLSWSSTGHQTVEPLCMCPGTCAHRNLVAPNTSLEKVACRKRGQ